MARTAFESVIRLQLERYGPEEARRRHIAVARSRLADFLAQQTTRPMVSIETDGHPAASEEAVKPFGVIVYRFNRMREIVRFALGEAERLSPVRSGRYKRSWFVMAANARIGLDAIPPGVPITLTNDQPYARKINVGAKGFERYVPPGIVEKVRQLVLKRYKLIVDAEIDFLQLAGGYTLRQSSGRGKARRRGAALTYPALILTPKF